MHNEFIFTLFLIFSGAAVLATLALFTRQALLVAYIALGAILGPSGVGYVSDPTTLQSFSNFGILSLLFLLGLNLPPQNLVNMLRETTWVTLISSALFAGVGYAVSIFSGFSTLESLVVGLSMMFSSTIIGLKLLPTTVLHHQRTGEIVISILLLQDIIAIFALLVINAAGTDDALYFSEFLTILIGLPAIILLAFAVERTLLSWAFKRFSRIHEYVFLVAIGWCLALSALAEYLSLSAEIGAFIGGISLANSPIARFVAENLKPLRDFFLILFFFTLGAGIDFHLMKDIAVPALVLATLILVLKPTVLRMLLCNVGDTQSRAWEVGFRLGQSSEFSLLVAFVAFETGTISAHPYYLIQAATLLTFIASSYLIVMRYPTPIAVSEHLRRD